MRSMASMFEITITTSRRRFLDRLQIFPRAWRWVPSLFSREHKGSWGWVGLRICAAWLVAGIQFRIDGRVVEVI